MIETIANPYLRLGFLNPNLIANKHVVLSFPNTTVDTPVDTFALSRWMYLKFRPPLLVTYTNAKGAKEHTCRFYVFPWDNLLAINEFLSQLQVEYPIMELKVVDPYNS